MSLTIFLATRVAARWLSSFAATLVWLPFAYVKSVCIYDTSCGLAGAREVYMFKLVMLVPRSEDIRHHEWVARWQATHMPAVIKHVRPDEYRVTFFDVEDSALRRHGGAVV